MKLHSRFPAAILVGLLAATTAAFAQDLRPKNFGTDDLIVDVVPAYDFQPLFNTVGYSSASGYRAAIGPGAPQLVANFGRIPQGARLESIQFFYYDNEGEANLRLRACRQSRPTAAGGPGIQECFVDFTSSGAPGFATVEVPVPAEFRDHILVGDVDGDTLEDTADYYFIADTNANSIQTAIGAVRINWRRQVSPAPSAATFNDVPTSHPQFQFIEALAASGVTAGCGGGNYCPTANLTRGQMAVFLAKALGLHWSP